MSAWKMKLGAVVCLAAFAVPGFALAASTPVSSGGSPGQGLEISPPVEELSANPGQTLTVKIDIRDVANGELIAKAEADDFGAGTSETGVPQILLNESGATRYSLKYWIAPVANVDLEPQQLTTVPITINVPADAEPGGHYGVVRFTGVPPNLEGTGVALSASIGTLFLLTVNGPVTHQLSVVQFAGGQNNANSGSFTIHKFFEHGPIGFLVRIRNSGSVHEQPVGTITVKNAFGGRVGVVAVNSNSGNILPDSIRRFTESLGTKQLFGYYSAKLAMVYAGNKTLSASFSFWVIPWKLVLLIIVGLVVVLFLLRLALRKYNEHIIKTASRR